MVLRCEVGIAEAPLLRRTRTRNLAAASLSSACRLKTQGRRQGMLRFDLEALDVGTFWDLYRKGQKLPSLSSNLRTRAARYCNTASGDHYAGRLLALASNASRARPAYHSDRVPWAVDRPNKFSPTLSRPHNLLRGLTAVLSKLSR